MIDRLTTWLSDATFSVRNVTQELRDRGLFNIAKDHGKIGARLFGSLMLILSVGLVPYAIFMEVKDEIAEFYRDCYDAIVKGEL